MATRSSLPTGGISGSLCDYVELQSDIQSDFGLRLEALRVDERQDGIVALGQVVTSNGGPNDQPFRLRLSVLDDAGGLVTYVWQDYGRREVPGVQNFFLQAGHAEEIGRITIDVDALVDEGPSDLSDVVRRKPKVEERLGLTLDCMSATATLHRSATTLSVCGSIAAAAPFDGYAYIRAVVYGVDGRVLDRASTMVSYQEIEDEEAFEISSIVDTVKPIGHITVVPALA
jgi:hypothetical protein